MDTIKFETSEDLFKDFIIEHDPAVKADELEDKAEESEKELEKTKETNKSKDSDILKISKGDNAAEELEKALTEDSDEDQEEPDEDDAVQEGQDKPADKKDSDNESEVSYKGLASYLADEGILSFEDSEDLEDNPDVLVEAVKKTVSELITDYKESLPPVVSDLVSYIEKGGDPSKYLESIQKPVDPADLDLEKESSQKLVLKEYLKLQDYTEDEINELIQDYEEGMILEKQAKMASKKLEKVYEKRREQLIAEQEAVAEANKKQYEEYISSLETTIESAKELAGLPISAAEKKEFKAYLLNKGKDGLTSYQKDYQEDPVKTQVELAYLKFKKFDFSKIEKKAESKAASKIFKKIKSSETTVKGASTEVNLESKKSDLSGFRSIWG